MAVAFDKFTSSAGLEDVTNHSFSVTPVGTPRGVLVLISSSEDAESITAATYGGVSMTRLSGAPNVLASGETAFTDGWFLGASVPTGTQTVALTGTLGGEAVVVCVTLTADADLEVVDTDVTINATSGENPSRTLALGGRASFCAIAFASGQGAVSGITPFTNWTAMVEADHGQDVVGFYRYDIIGTTDVAAGWTQTSEDQLAVAVAISEVAGGGGGGGKPHHYYAQQRAA